MAIISRQPHVKDEKFENILSYSIHIKIRASFIPQDMVVSIYFGFPPNMYVIDFTISSKSLLCKQAKTSSS